MGKLLTLLYTIWCGFWITALFVLLFPFMYLFLQREAWKPYAHKVNYVWGRLFFWVAGLPVQVRYDYRPDPAKTYVFCANHFSYLDIAVMGVIIRNYYAFVGKVDLTNVPLFGYMFANLHIKVDREEARSRMYSLRQCLRTLMSGRSIMIFPEGGIVADHPPKMHYPFKDGAFTMAIQRQVPIVPVTLLTNHKILPDEKRVRMHWHPVRAVVHEPIETRGMTMADVERLKEETYRIIDTTLMSQPSVKLTSV